MAWRNRTKTLLMNCHLWNIVETTTEPTTPASSKKNALALYLIRESGGLARCDSIKKINNAKHAWDTLANTGSNLSPENTHALTI